MNGSHLLNETATRVVAGIALLGAIACGARGDSDAAPGASTSTPSVSVAAADTAVVTETWITPLDSNDNVDGPAVWFSPDGPRVIASAKSTDVLIVYDAVTGAPLRRVGGTGTANGKLRRPNGVLVLGDSLLLVVERDNHRVQVFRLPSFASAGTFGAADLRLPYGLTAYQPDAGKWRVFVTDNYETADEQVPPLGELGARVKWYDLAVANGRVTAPLGGAFGDTTAAGAIRIAESIMVDPVQGTLVIAEEDEADTYLKEYSLDGRFTGRAFGRGLFKQQAEGIALFACPDTSGYWITTDQGDGVNIFHLFDRRTLAHVGKFTGAVTRRTDGVALTQRAVGERTAGMFFAAHIDAGIAALDWTQIAQVTGATAGCRA